MRPFEYFEPVSLVEACAMLSEHRGEAKVMAGGQSLLPLLKARLIAPRYIINLKGLPELEYINTERGVVRIGALTTHRTVETSPVIRERFPTLVEMERVLATVQIRNWGTIGGDLCHADPAGDPAPPLIALGAKVRVMSIRGEREISLEEFFIGLYETVLEPDEILVEIQLPNTAPHTGGAYFKESIRLGDCPIISVAAVATLDEDGIKKARIVLGAAGSTPIRAKEAEKVLAGRVGTRDVLEEMGKVVAQEVRPVSDAMGSAEYKREITKVITKRAISQAIEQAKLT